MIQAMVPCHRPRESGVLSCGLSYLPFHRLDAVRPLNCIKLGSLAYTHCIPHTNPQLKLQTLKFPARCACPSKRVDSSFRDLEPRQGEYGRFRDYWGVLGLGRVPRLLPQSSFKEPREEKTRDSQSGLQYSYGVDHRALRWIHILDPCRALRREHRGPLGCQLLLRDSEGDKVLPPSAQGV